MSPRKPFNAEALQQGKRPWIRRRERRYVMPNLHRPKHDFVPRNNTLKTSDSVSGLSLEFLSHLEVKCLSSWKPSCEDFQIAVMSGFGVFGAWECFKHALGSTEQLPPLTLLKVLKSYKIQNLSFVIIDDQRNLNTYHALFLFFLQLVFQKPIRHLQFFLQCHRDTLLLFIGIGDGARRHFAHGPTSEIFNIPPRSMH